MEKTIILDTICLPLENIYPLIDKIQHTDFRISKELLNSILVKAGEMPFI